MNNQSVVNLRAMVVAVGAGILAAGLLVIIGVLLLGGPLLGMMSAGGGMSVQTLIGSMGAFAAAFACICCLALLLCIGDGALYAWLAHRAGTPLEIGPMAMGGALTTLIAAIFVEISGISFSFARTLINNESSIDQALAESAESLLLGVVVYSVLYLILGALGAILYTLITRRRSQPTAEQAT